VAAAVASGTVLPGVSRRVAVVVQSAIVPAFGTGRTPCMPAWRIQCPAWGRSGR